MSIDLSSLGMSKATIGINTGTPGPYRIDPDRIKTDLAAAKENGSVRSLLNESQTRAAANSSTGEVRILSNYGPEAFFQKEMPDQTNANGGYTVGGVSFSEQQLTQTRSVLMAAADSIAAGPGKNTNLDYRNYAQMSIAENAVRSYARDNLSSEQQDVVNEAMRSYNNALVDMQKSLLGVGKNASSGTSYDYYGSQHVLTQDEADQLNAMKAEMSRLTGRTYQMSQAGDYAGYDQIATNQDLIDRISGIFENADMSAPSGRDSALSSYVQVVKPAYLVQGASGENVIRILTNDCASLSGQFDRIMSHARPSIDVAG